MLRIRKTRWKVAYFAVTVILLGVLNRYLMLPYLPDPLRTIVGDVLITALVLGATRTFRGRGEPMKPPRAWWRASARPAASYVVGGLWAAAAVAAIALPAPEPTVYLVMAFASNLILAAYFINSAIRLQRFPQPTVPDPIPAPRFKPIKR